MGSAEDGTSNNSPSTVTSEVATSSTTVSTDVIDTGVTADSCDVKTGQQTTEETPPIPSAASDVNNSSSDVKATPSSARPGKRKRGRPPLHSEQAAERRHRRLLDVCTCQISGLKKLCCFKYIYLTIRFILGLSSDNAKT